MTLAHILFYVLVAVAVFSAAGVLLSRNVFHAALFLILCLLAIAGIYVVLNAEFLAVAQILVYAGGVLVLIIFGIMLTVRITGKPPEAGRQYMFTGSLVCASLFVALTQIIGSTSFNQPMSKPADDLIKQTGIELVTTFAAPFELSGILLLISLVGAALAASYQKEA